MDVAMSVREDLALASSVASTRRGMRHWAHRNTTTSRPTNNTTGNNTPVDCFDNATLGVAGWTVEAKTQGRGHKQT